MPASSQASRELSTASLTAVRRAFLGLSKPSRCLFFAKNSLTDMSRCFAAIDSAVTARRFHCSPVSLTFGIFVFFHFAGLYFGTHDGPGKDSKSLHLLGYHKERRNSQRQAWHRIRTETPYCLAVRATIRVQPLSFSSEWAVTRTPLPGSLPYVCRRRLHRDLFRLRNGQHERLFHGVVAKAKTRLRPFKNPEISQYQHPSRSEKVRKRCPCVASSFSALVILETRTIEIRLHRRKFDRQVKVTQSLDLRFQNAAEENHSRLRCRGNTGRC